MLLSEFSAAAGPNVVLCALMSPPVVFRGDASGALFLHTLASLLAPVVPGQCLLWVTRPNPPPPKAKPTERARHTGRTPVSGASPTR